MSKAFTVLVCLDRIDSDDIGYFSSGRLHSAKWQVLLPLLESFLDKSDALEDDEATGSSKR